MKSYLEYINEAVTTKSSFMKFYDALKEVMPDSDLSKIDKKTYLIDMFGTLYVGGKILFNKRCGDDNNIVKTALDLLTKLFDEKPQFIQDIYDGKTPKSSKYIKPNAKISKMMDKYFLWDRGVIQIPWGRWEKVTLKDIIDGINNGKKFYEIIDLRDSEYNQYVAWLASIASGKTISRY